MLAQASIQPQTASAEPQVVEIAKGLVRPWGLAFLPSGRMLVSERVGRLRYVELDGTLSAPLTGLPENIAVDGQPLHYWVPSIAPSGMAFYTGDKFPQWRNSLLVGSLKFGLLARLTLDGDKVIAEERLLTNLGERVRDVRQGPDGFVYLLTDSLNGRILKLLPL